MENMEGMEMGVGGMEHIGEVGNRKGVEEIGDVENREGVEEIGEVGNREGVGEVGVQGEDGRHWGCRKHGGYGRGGGVREKRDGMENVGDAGNREGMAEGEQVRDGRCGVGCGQGGDERH